MDDPKLPLEDEFGDIIKKASRGAGLDNGAVAAATGIAESQLAAWQRYEGRASEAQARALAALLHLDADKLVASAHVTWYPPAIAVPNVRRHAQLPHPSNGYVYTLAGRRRTALIDPAGKPANLLATLRAGEYDIAYILITHEHADHCDAATEIAAAYPNATIVMHERDVHAIGSLVSRTTLVKDGQALDFDGEAIRLLHTPGHTDGSVCYAIGKTVFTGDILFAASVGGAYAKTTTHADILNSIRTKLFTLPHETVVMPGHGPASTIDLELAHNPFF